MKRTGDKKHADGFNVRTVMTMATEMADARDSMNRVCIQFVALAASIGVVVAFENLSGS